MSSPAESKQSLSFETPHSFSLNGLDINCGPVLVLPAICVVTGDRTEIVEIKSSFMYRSDFLILLGPVYWLVYYVFRRGTHRCHVSYFLSRKLFVLKRRLRLAAFGLLLGSIAVFWHGVTMNRVDMTPFYVGILLLVAAAVTCHFSFSPLSAVAFDGARVFRIHGFTQAFHEAARSMYAATAACAKREKKIQRSNEVAVNTTESKKAPRPKRKSDPK